MQTGPGSYQASGEDAGSPELGPFLTLLASDLRFLVSFVGASREEIDRKAPKTTI